MGQPPEIDFEQLLERSIKHFQPVRPLWSVGLRLALWLVLEAAILILSAQSVSSGMPALIRYPGALIGTALMIVTGSGAGLLALRSAIPGREVIASELLLLAGVLCLAFTVGFEPSAGASLAEELSLSDSLLALEIVGLTFLPWVALLCAVRRGVPLHPAKTGALVGIASFSFTLAALRFMSRTGFVGAGVWQLLFGLVVTGVSAAAGALWLDPTRLWQQDAGSIEARTTTWTSWGKAAVLPLAVCASSAALLLALKTAESSFARIPDFDLAVESYERSLSSFQPNVPSTSIEMLLTAYVELGMPAYMWDFSRQGFKFVGGRFEHLPGGVPVTFTWFRGAHGGVMCMFRQTDGFKAPSAIHEEHNHLLFYRYRGFSICLINIGGYGSFLSVILAKIPMNQFMPLVLEATR